MNEGSAPEGSLDAVRSDERNRTALSHWANGGLSGTWVRSRDEPAFVLTTWPWKESSLIVELYTKRHGRVGVTARGAKRPGNRFRGLLSPFQPLLVGYSGRNELKNLTDARWLGTLTPNRTENLVAGFYLNELIYRLTVRENPLPELFDAYTRTLTAVASAAKPAMARTLREFEVDLLRCCGWGQRIEGDLEMGPCVVRQGELLSLEQCEPEEDERIYTGRSVRAVLTRDFSDPGLEAEVRSLLRDVLRAHLGTHEVGSRQVLRSWFTFLK